MNVRTHPRGFPADQKGALSRLIDAAPHGFAVRHRLVPKTVPTGIKKAPTGIARALMVTLLHQAAPIPRSPYSSITSQPRQGGHSFPIYTENALAHHRYGAGNRQVAHAARRARHIAATDGGARTSCASDTASFAACPRRASVRGHGPQQVQRRVAPLPDRNPSWQAGHRL